MINPNTETKVTFPVLDLNTVIYFVITEYALLQQQTLALLLSVTILDLKYEKSVAQIAAMLTELTRFTSKADRT